MKLLLLVFFCLGVSISYSSDSYFGMWVGIEISSIPIYSLLLSDKSESSCVALVKILVLQAVSSALLLLGSCVLLSFENEGSIGWFLVVVSILFNVGGFSIGWLIFTLESLDWWGVFLVLGAQKLPLMVVLLSLGKTFVAWFNVLCGVLLSLIAFLGCIMTTFRSFIVVSSVLNIGWVWCSCAASSATSSLYFGFYLLSFAVICAMLGQSFLKEYGSMFEFGLSTKLEVLGVWLVSGLPPFVLFFCKVDVISLLVECQFIFEAYVLIFISAVLIYMYGHIIYVALLANLPYSVGNSLSNGLVNWTSVGVVISVVFPISLLLL